MAYANVGYLSDTDITPTLLFKSLDTGHRDLKLWVARSHKLFDNYPRGTIRREQLWRRVRMSCYS